MCCNDRTNCGLLLYDHYKISYPLLPTSYLNVLKCP